MHTPKLGLALFTLRTLDASLPELIRHAATAGFDGVELVHRIHEEFDADAVNEAFAETGLDRVGVHVWLHELEDDVDGLVDQYGAIGVDTFVIPYHPESNVRTEARLRHLVARLNAVGEALEARGCHLLYHPNHWDMLPLFDGPVLGRVPSLRLTDRVPSDGFAVRQFRRVEDELLRRRNRQFDRAAIRLGLTDNNAVETLLGETPFGYLLRETSPEAMNFEVDVTFFVQQGYDPAAVLDVLGPRVQRVHAKDVVTSNYTPGGWPSFVNAGEGDVDFERVVAAAERNGVEWVLFENGHATEPLDSISRGHDYLRTYVPAEESAAVRRSFADAVSRAS
jgi:sugar phosphate isomerase/epimerase